MRAGYRTWLMAALLVAGISTSTHAQPSISKFSPQQGRPGVQVVIEGSGFANARAVAFHDLQADFTVVSNTRILAVVPRWAVSGPITVLTPTASRSSLEHFRVAPRIFEFNPPRSATNMVISIHGENFSGATNVIIGGASVAPNAFAVTAPSQIRALVPFGATNGPVTVATPAGRAVSETNFIVTGPGPIIDFVNPPVSPPGETVVIRGANLTNVTSVRFNNVAANFSMVSHTQLRAVVPNATTGPLTVTTTRGTTNAPQNFVVTRAPVIFRFTPVFGTAGTSVVVEGMNLLNIVGVGFNRVPVTAFGTPAPNQLHVNVPPNAQSGPIYVTNTFGVGVSPNIFTVTAAPIITEVTPMLGTPNTQVVIRGGNLNTATAVRFGGRAANFSAVANTQINAIVPAGAQTGPISVTNPAGATSTPVPFIVVGTAPYVLSVQPDAAPRGASVSIFGANFNNVQAVRFGGVAAVSGQAVSPTEIVAIVPPGARTGPVTVTTPAGTSTNAVIFFASPRLTSFNPFQAITGSEVVLQGTNFVSAFEVQFNGVPAPFEVVATNIIQTEVPLGARSGRLSVHTFGGDIVSTNDFLVLPFIESFSPPAGPIGTSVTIRGTGFFDVLSVSIGNANATFTRISSTEIVAVVPFQARTGPIQVRTTAGVASGPVNFIVGGIADLSVSQTAVPSTTIVGEEISYRVTVTNLGPNSATGVVLTNSLPAGITLLSATVSRGTHTTSPGLIRANFGNLTSGGTARLDFVARAISPGTLTNRASVGSSDFDPDLANNVSTNLVTVTGDVLQLEVSRVGGQVTLSWPAAAANYALESRPSFVPGTSWEMVAGQPQVIGDRRVLTVQAANQSRYFRLRRE
jgi:large repetitive protein